MSLLGNALQAAFPKRRRRMMSEPDNASTWPSAMIPPDDPKRQFTIADPDGPRARHVSVSGGTYTILVTGGDSAGRYCLIDMLVPAGSGPPPHRHDFEEMFTLLEGELEFTVRGLHIVNPSQNNVVALKRRKNHSGIVLLKTSGLLPWRTTSTSRGSRRAWTLG